MVEFEVRFRYPLLLSKEVDLRFRLLAFRGAGGEPPLPFG
jgi:hypothetical protein